MKEDHEHHTEGIQEEELVPNEQEISPDITSETNEHDVPQIVDEVSRGINLQRPLELSAFSISLYV